MNGHARVAIYSCILNAALVGIKLGLSNVSGSLALKADAIHSLADVVSSLAIFVGIVISGRKTKTFPEGLYKVENLVALFSSFFIFYAAFEIVHEAFVGESIDVIRHIPLVTGGILASMVVAFLFSRYELKVGLKVGSPSLVADAKHVTTDLLSSVVILAGVYTTWLGYSVDRYVAVFVAIIVVRMGYQIFIDAIKVLLDATLDYPTLDGIRRLALDHPGVSEVVNVGGRSSGRFKFVEMTLTTDERLLSRAHDHMSRLEEEILDQWPSIDRILIHYEPEQKDVRYIAVPLKDYAKDLQDHDPVIDDHFGEAPFFALIALSKQDGTVSVHEFIENPYKDLEHRKGIKAAELLGSFGVDEVRSRVSMEGKGASYALEALQIEIEPTDAETLGQLIAEVGASTE
ncbi:MAG: cation diffusion facilitator family transporter [Desulfomonilaceae bacterium]|nr:cation diffusion facilitator family transporter [Desulfomonilaceae bacterium]